MDNFKKIKVAPDFQKQLEKHKTAKRADLIAELVRQSFLTYVAITDWSFKEQIESEIQKQKDKWANKWGEQLETRLVLGNSYCGSFTDY